MRTIEQFERVMKDAQWFVNFHKKPVWVCPTDDEYAISIIKPSPRDVPDGCAAVLMGVDGELTDEKVESGKK